MLSTAQEKPPAIDVEANARLIAGTDLIFVCELIGVLVGVVTKTDVVLQIGVCLGSVRRLALASVESPFAHSPLFAFIHHPPMEN